jgi:hypothetical protein
MEWCIIERNINKFFKYLKINFLFAWYDLWMGIFIDQKKRKLYIFPVPMFGLVIYFPPQCKSCKSFMFKILDEACCNDCNSDDKYSFVTGQYFKKNNE